ncbi:MAG: hypothetical protein JSR70_07555 [Proteobacteria bacterium]|nr:hypothetical protein [Pseudomonadota bacterium]
MIDTMNAVGVDLAAYVQDTKLSGQLLKVRTGNLRRSINNEVRDSAGVTWAVVGSNQTAATYAPALEDGSKPHPIIPRDAMVLCFQLNGEKRFFKRVNHPGTRAYRFLKGSLAERGPAEVERIRADMLQYLREEIG